MNHDASLHYPVSLLAIIEGHYTENTQRFYPSQTARYQIQRPQSRYGFF